jgi:hypothetical protein
MRPRFLSFTTVPIQKRKTTRNPPNLKRKARLLLSAKLRNIEGTVIKIQNDNKKGRKLSFSLAKK